MSDAWEEIQAIKSKRNSLRERLEKRKKERQELLGSSLGKRKIGNRTTPWHNYFLGSASPINVSDSSSKSVSVKEEQKQVESEDLVKLDPELENGLLKELSEVTLQLPVSSLELLSSFKQTVDRDTTHKKICNLLEKFAIQKLITVKSSTKDGIYLLEVLHVEVSKVNAMILECASDKSDLKEETLKRKRDNSPDVNENDEEKKKKDKKEPKADLMVITLTSMMACSCSILSY